MSYAIVQHLLGECFPPSCFLLLLNIHKNMQWLCLVPISKQQQKLDLTFDTQSTTIINFQFGCKQGLFRCAPLHNRIHTLTLPVRKSRVWPSLPNHRCKFSTEAESTIDKLSKIRQVLSFRCHIKTRSNPH